MSLPDIGFVLDALPVTVTRERVIELFEGDGLRKSGRRAVGVALRGGQGSGPTGRTGW